MPGWWPGGWPEKDPSLAPKGLRSKGAWLLHPYHLTSDFWLLPHIRAHRSHISSTGAASGGYGKPKEYIAEVLSFLRSLVLKNGTTMENK